MNKRVPTSQEENVNILFKRVASCLDEVQTHDLYGVISFHTSLSKGKNDF